MAHVEITDDGGGRGTVTVDGHDLSRAVQRVSVNLAAGGTAEIELDLAVLEVTRLNVLGAQVVIPGDTRDALVKLGWTPPEER